MAHWVCADCGLTCEGVETRETGPCEDSVSTKLPWTNAARKRRAVEKAQKEASEEAMGKYARIEMDAATPSNGTAVAAERHGAGRCSKPRGGDSGGFEA